MVRLLTYDSFALADETAEAFREQTGASIEVVQAGDSGAMLAGALLNAGSPEADVIFGIDNTTARRLPRMDSWSRTGPMPSENSRRPRSSR
ncbi:MAG: hypothetical protein R2789_03505 [Microthrixaceae bacterium]